MLFFSVQYTHKYILLQLLILIPSVIIAQEAISSKIIDVSKNIPVSDAAITVKGTTKGTYTNKSGVFNLEGVKPEAVLQITKIGYQSLELPVKNLETIVYLLPEVSVLDAVVLRSFSSSQLKKIAPDQIRLSKADIEKLPFILGEKDVIKLIQYTPGVQQAAEGQSGLFVRGGNGSMNLTLLDNIYLHNTAHLGGLFSAINSDFVDNLEFSKAGFDARFGGRLASVTHIETLKTPDSTTFSGSIGLLAAKLTGNIKLNTNNSVLVSGRRSYLETIAPFFKDEDAIINTDKIYTLHDILIKHDIDISKKSNLQTTFYSTFDRFKDETKGRNRKFQWGNTLLGATFSHKFNERLTTQTTVSKSAYDFSIADAEFPFDYNARNAFEVLNASHTFLLKTNKYLLETGIAYNNNTILPKDVQARIEEVPVEILNQEHYKYSDFSIFIDLEMPLTKRLEAKAGLRFTGYFTEANALIESDTFLVLEPRLSFKYQYTDNHAIKLSYQKLNQFIHQASIGTLSLPADFFVVSTDAFKPQLSHQVSLGYIYENNSTQWNSAVYYKDVANYTEFENGSVNNLFSNNIYDDILIGTFKSYGLELSINKKVHKFTGQAALTLSKTIAKFDAINAGNYFPATFDRPINVNAIGHYRLNDRIDLSALFIFTSGQNFTRPQDIRIVSQRPIINFEPKNASRFPSYHRLDVSCTYAFKPKGKWQSKLNLTLYNVYNNPNPFQIAFFTLGDTEDESVSITETRDNLFPFLPTINWLFSF